MKNKYVLFAGPYPPPVHGQSFAFKMAYDNYHDYKILISQNLEERNNLYKIWLTKICIYKYLVTFLTKNISVVYLTGSRSRLGAFKDIVLIILAKGHGAKVINHIHAAHFNKFLNSLPTLVSTLYCSAYRKVDVFVCLLHDMKKEYKEFELSSRIEVVENFYDPIMDSSKEHELHIEEPIVISYFSNLIFSKGIFDLIEAFEIANSKYPNIRLQIAGSYGEDSYMSAVQVKEKLSKCLLLNSNIKYVGSKYGKAKIDFLQRSQIFVLPSFYSSEAFPISILEAMRAGNAIILTDHHYLAKLITKEQGIVIPASNIEALVQALASLIDDKERLLDMRRNNRVYSSVNYSMYKYSNRLNSIIQSLTKE
ncbi:MAG: glycosyltransferase family 4 protein [Saprospiraceae bacterium]